ncbi:nuclease-related domain-containing protein [Gracilibacillus phocaeensis]|uniref:nuclease-related domain-containing protein n=1 Tax=Gracilibacillus phocaeensis TaxID=2042304 RepID=UPI001031C134|nr:nuclease-related domain-containing protein [Gracilibacillus phocaeensis]
MIMKTLQKPDELSVYQALHERQPFSSEEKLAFQNLQQGYLGESRLATLLSESVMESFLIVHDLRLQIGTTTFQIDALIFTGATIYLLEVKHYTGDYKYDNKIWYKIPDHEISNPMLQLQRSESLLRRWLHAHHVTTPLEARILFTHDQFFLYQAPVSKHFVFSTQLLRFIRSINQQAPAEMKEQRIAQQLIDADLGAYPHPSLPAYSYDRLRKGIRCRSCARLTVVSTGRKLTCSRCGAVESMEEGLLRHIGELRLLFPGEKLTSQLVYGWSEGIYSMKSIKRLLEKHFTPVGKHKWTYYID